MKTKRRAVILQSGGCTAVINQSLAGVLTAARKSSGFGSILGARFGILGVLENRFLNLSLRNEEALRCLRSSPSAALGSCRKKLTKNELGQALRVLQKNKAGTVFIIGGNDSAQTALDLIRASHKELQVIAIPKTIDNDLAGMDHTPGYGSVARFIAIATQEVSLDTQAMRHSDPVKIIETMGRNSGWIVAAASLGKKRKEDGPHLLYFPERAVNEEDVIQDVKRIYKKFGFVVIVLSETVRDSKGRRIGRAKEHVTHDSFGHAYVEETAQHLCAVLERSLGLRARFDKPGTIQRMSMAYVSKTDQAEAFRCGEEAVRLALKDVSGVMVAMQRTSNTPYTIRYDSVPLEKVIGRERPLPDEFISPSGHFVTSAFRRYAMPLLGNPLPVTTFLA